MKNLVRIAIVIVIFVAGCHKDQVKPTMESTSAPSDSIKRVLNASVVKAVVAPLNLNKAILRLAISKDTTTNLVDHDETIVIFDPTYHTAYNRMEDSKYFYGREETVSLANLSSDNISLSIGAFPYFQGESINLAISCQYSGNYVFKAITQNMPTGSHVWIYDSLKGNSTILDTKIFHFVVDITKPNTFSNRFSLTWK